MSLQTLIAVDGACLSCALSGSQTNLSLFGTSENRPPRTQSGDSLGQLFFTKREGGSDSVHKAGDGKIRSHWLCPWDSTRDSCWNLLELVGLKVKEWFNGGVPPSHRTHKLCAELRHKRL